MHFFMLNKEEWLSEIGDPNYRVYLSVYDPKKARETATKKPCVGVRKINGKIEKERKRSLKEVFGGFIWST